MDVDLWRGSVLPHRSSIHDNFCIIWCPFRFESLCMFVYSRRHDVMGATDLGAYVPALHQDTELHRIGHVY
jgi:hypothetical protein